MRVKNSIFWHGKEYHFARDHDTIFLLHEGDKEFTYAKYDFETLTLKGASTCVNGSCFPAAENDSLNSSFNEVAGIIKDST